MTRYAMPDIPEVAQIRDDLGGGWPFGEDDIRALLNEYDRLRAARDTDRVGYAVVQMLDGPTGVEPYFFYDRVAADRYAAEVSEAHGPKLAVVEVHQPEEAVT